MVKRRSGGLLGSGTREWWSCYKPENLQTPARPDPNHTNSFLQSSRTSIRCFPHSPIDTPYIPSAAPLRLTFTYFFKIHTSLLISLSSLFSLPHLDSPFYGSTVWPLYLYGPCNRNGNIRYLFVLALFLLCNNIQFRLRPIPSPTSSSSLLTIFLFPRLSYPSLSYEHSVYSTVW